MWIVKLALRRPYTFERLQGFQRVVSPFAGIVTARNIDTGALVSAGSNGQSGPLFRIAQTDTLRIYVTVPETSSRTIAPGQNASVTFREIPDKTFNAKVVRTALRVRSASRHVRRRIRSMIGRTIAPAKLAAARSLERWNSVRFCLLRRALDAEAESVELSSEYAKPQSELVAQRFEHYGLTTPNG
jgi:hypothetical protein